MDQTQKNPDDTNEIAASALPGDKKVGEVLGADLSGLMDVKMAISIELGRAKISLQELVNLNRGGILELDKNAGEPLNILVNGKLIAYGEVVSVNGKYGVRITELANKNERVE